MLLKALQHNCARGGPVMEAVLESAVKREADCHGACQLLGLDPWRRLECGRKECGVTPSGRMECGVTPSGRWISLKGAVAHFFLSFLPHATTCLSLFSNRSILSMLLSCPVPSRRRAPPLSCPVLGRRHAPLLSCPVLGRLRAPLLSCPVLGRRHAPLLSCPVRGRCRAPLLSCAVLGHRRAPLLSCPVLGRRRAPFLSLSLSSVGSVA